MNTYKYHCVFCGQFDPKKQTVRHVERDKSIFVFNCAYRRIKFSVIKMKEGFIHPKDNITENKMPPEYWL